MSHPEQSRHLATVIPGPKSAALIERKSAAVARGVGTTMPVYAAKAGGGIVEDVDGNRLIDLGSGIAVTTIGNSSPRVVDAVRTQVGEFTHTCFMVTPYEGYVAVCEQLNRLTPVAGEKQLRQSTDQTVQILALQFQATRCGEDDVLAGNDDPNLPLVTCSTDGQTVYLLNKSIMSGEEIKNATSGLDSQQGQYVVDVEFKSGGATTWADFTAANVGTQTAFTLDSRVVSAPEIREAIPGGNTQITGQFTADSAKELANVLKYGSLPLSFESSEAETVSATLGLSSLRAGLIAGAIGLAAVLIYSLLYYRVLGLLVALSLVASGAAVFAILVLLGRYIGYTLDLAGIAGLIIGIGTTADSFVVFFERIKDEIREGRSFRSAVPRGWARARKTIVSGNAVTFLAAAVLYFLAVGQVKGFAFTLGLTTILDLVVVFLVTWPLVYLASKSPTMAKPALNGLGAVQQIARERREAAHATAGRG
ncbi:protein translocase subunit SecD [Mycolicibacterium mageritense]|uniref:protein translocase subunit SecD n=1 Tax=Mycolicibacterium mageritense TaxID=53462 RepID=UPI001E515267|nr:protein translocase subunit SecD [Mycolicibacterium mageritense]MCC9184649.1 protein translocase subunit SecD [Mycolicibacterium mageritense]